MKRVMFFSLLVMIGFAPVAVAQTGKKESKQQTVKKKTAGNKKSQKNTTAGDGTVVMTSATSNEARSTVPARRFSIADPTINALNRRAAGSNVPISSSGIVGMPKRAYGFANGKILLRNTTASSPGTAYGSGSVGTGTAIMGVGTGENAIGVNGKNPYAGPWLWGSRLPNNQLPVRDSGRRK